MARYFPAIVEKANEGFGVFFPDLPGCTSAGATVQEAALSAEEALQAHIDLSVEHGEPIPEPTPLDRIATDPDVIEVARILVQADPSGRAVPVNITIGKKRRNGTSYPRPTPKECRHFGDQSPRAGVAFSDFGDPSLQRHPGQKLLAINPEKRCPTSMPSPATHAR